MVEMLINNWGWWIWDDPFLYRDWECLDMQDIDIRTTPRKISCDSAFFGSYATETAPYNDTLYYATETVDWLVQSYGSHCYINSTNIDALVAWADMHITVGSNVSDYNSTTNPEGIRHIFFTYNNSTNQIKIVWYSGWTRAIIWSAINTSGWAAPANIPALYRTTAVCYLWKGAIIFARGSKIYELNPETAVLSTWAKIELPVGAVVKYITYQGWLINIVYTINNDTFIHGCTYDWTNYKLYPYADKTVGEKCLSAVANGAFINWISTTGIFLYNWTSQLVKKVTFTTWAVCSYNKWVLRIWDGTDFYEYGVQKPWYWNPLTKKTNPISIYWVTENYVLTFQSGANKFRQDSPSWAYKNSTYTTHPYTAWQFWITKKWLWLRIGYTLPRSTYTDSSIQCSITVAIQTYDMYASNTTTFVTIATITDKTKTSREIMFTEIAKLLWDAWYSEEFEYFRLKLTLNAWDPYAAYSNTLFRKTPEVYDIFLTHQEIKQSF